MSLTNKPLESLDKNDLQALLDNQVAEGKTIDYKESLCGNSDSDKKEFLYDVSSFANASGGHLIFGIKEDAGVPTEICGLDIRDIDAVILRLENSIRDGIAPRIPGLATRAIPISDDKVVILFRIPRSFSQPHMVTFKNASKFYSRNSAGKYQLDVGELRTAFTLSQNTIDRIRSFRQERLSMIVSGETPININSGAKLVLHIIPIGAFDPASNFDVASLQQQPPPPLCETGWDFRYNLDGFLTFWQTKSYVQTFRNGIIEAVDAFMLEPRQDLASIPSTKYEQEILKGVSEYLLVQKKLGVEPPLFIMLSFLGVKDYFMWINSESLYSRGHRIERDNLLIPEVMVEDFNLIVHQVMKPIFDAVWNAAGYPCSQNYDREGNWKR
ncbi:MAG: AlbA family DNA-binding domain-containing protein [Xenococcaceae cyanobacterium]